MPRLLVVATQPMEGEDRESAYNRHAINWLLTETSCYCMKYMCGGEDNMHLLVPGKYEQCSLASIKDVYQRALDESRSYDAIVVDSEACAAELKRWAEGLNPKPVVLIYTRHDKEAAQKLRDSGKAAIAMGDMLANQTTTSVYDDVLAKELGEEGLARLACRPGEACGTEQWANSPNPYKEVAPMSAIRQVDRSNGDASVRL